jgi:hypothetical protein
MPDYEVFGGVLRATIDFPQLPAQEREGEPDWSLEVVAGPAPDVTGMLAGSEELSAGIHAVLRRTPDGVRLAFDDIGTFDISQGGRRITWYPRPGCDEELARVDILGRVLSTAVHEQGRLALHGSAVAVGGKAVAFLAPKGSGKSTLALTLASHGAPLLTDDTLPVDPSSALAYPGVHAVRLRDDAAERFRTLGEWRTGLSNKRTVDTLPSHFVQRAPVPMAAFYELVARPAGTDGDTVRRERYSAAEGSMRLMAHLKLGGLLGGVETMKVFDRCVALADRVPVYRLDVTRALEALDDVAREIAGWHL